ncbi:MFS transporter [Nocardiopsis sp. RSe5-2]|uniref:MFS transporter n=1 Tax=Nocardiopsis endophytica TaxID=3018445 RepID=A0ABT4UDP0_9ACTN|nr:MFS transporter [Nocardiopsis endophytica]MDA2815102.1 MFS transporter [Nocardiopsis endophytica]
MAPPVPETERRAFRTLWFGQFAAVAGLTVVVPLLPFYLASLGLGPAEVAWWTGVSLAAPAVAQLAAAPLWGMVGDRYGHKAMVVRAHAGLALAVGLMALADGPALFLACRLLQGACGGVVGATATYASTLAEDGRRGRALGTLFGATGAGSLVGPLVGGVLAGRFGFGALFGCVAALLVVAAALAAVLLPNRRAARPAAGGPARPGLRTTIGRIAADPCGRSLVAAGMLGQASVFALVVVFAPRVAELTGSVAAASVWVGVLQAATWAASLAGGPWWGARNDRGRPAVSFAVAAAGCGVAVALQGVPASAGALLPLRAAQGFCFAALVQSVQHTVCRVVPEQSRGAALGTANGLVDTGQVIGPLLGALMAGLLPAPAAFAAIGALLLAASGLAAWGVRGGAPSPVPDRLAPSRP